MASACASVRPESPRASVLARIYDLPLFRARGPTRASGPRPHAFARRLTLGTRKRSQGDGAALSSVSRTLKRSRSAKTTARLVKDAAHDGGSPYQGLAAFAMSSPDLATPSEEWAEWNIAPAGSKRPAERAEVVDGSRGIPDSGAHGPDGQRIPPFPPPVCDTLPARRARMREESAPVDEQAKQAFRAEALAKLTTPTPTPITELDGFPFPAVEAAPGAAVLAEPDASPRAGTHRAHGTSSPSPSRLGADSPTVPPASPRAITVESHPEPVPLDIDLRGRLVRARNSPRASDSPGLTISSRSSTPSDLTGPEGPQWISSRESRTSTLTTLSSEESSPPRPSSSQKVTGSPIAGLSVVDEDARNPAGTRHRPRMPLNRRSTPKPIRAREVSDRLTEDAHEETVPLTSRQTRPNVAQVGPRRPYRLSTTERSFSSSLVTDLTMSQREEVQASPRDVPLSFVKSASSGVALPAALPDTDRFTRPRRQQRFLSDPALGEDASRPVSGEAASTPRRTRHQSFGLPSEGISNLDRSPSRRWSGAVRTRLVVREQGKPAVTYQLGECIGRGQFGSVFRALSLDDGKVVAIKRIALAGRTKDEISQLSNEITFLQKLSHPAVVKYEGVVRTENYLNIILELVENGSLQQTLKQFGQLPEGLVAGYVAKILEGLAYLHAQGVVHCDLKAANVLSTKNGNIKLSDFGVSLQIHAIKTTRGLAGAANDINGTPNWMAPEVISMAGASTASDIWSLAATICELICGHPPYHDLVAMSAMFRIVEDDMPPLPEFASPELQDFLKKCFSKLPQERPTAAALFTHPWLLRNARDVSHNFRPQDSLLPAVVVGCSPRIEIPLHTGLREASSPASAPSPPGLVPSQRRHDFVKITSSRAVNCRLCGESSSRLSVLCKECGLIAHSRCREFAPPCNLRTNLLFSRVPTVSSRPQSGESTFSRSDWNPFSKNRRSRQSSHRSSEEHSLTKSGSPAAKSPTRPVADSAQAQVRSPSNSPLGSFGKTAALPSSSPSPAAALNEDRRTREPRAALSVKQITSQDPPVVATAVDAPRPHLVRSPRISIDEPQSPRRAQMTEPRAVPSPPSTARSFKHRRSASQPVIGARVGTSAAGSKLGDCKTM